MNISTFRSNFPEFGNVTKYDENVIVFWSTFSEDTINSVRFGNMYERAVMLSTAHYLVLATQNIKAENVGGNAGEMSGPKSAKTVGAVSVSMDTNAVLEKDAGHWNSTSYGKMFIHLARVFGQGAIQL